MKLGKKFQIRRKESNLNLCLLRREPTPEHPLYVCKDCAVYMVLLVSKFKGMTHANTIFTQPITSKQPCIKPTINSQPNPTGTCDAPLISFPLVGGDLHGQNGASQIRTDTYRNQNPMPYLLAIAHYFYFSAPNVLSLYLFNSLYRQYRTAFLVFSSLTFIFAQITLTTMFTANIINSAIAIQSIIITPFLIF